MLIWSAKPACHLVREGHRILLPSALSQSWSATHDVPTARFSSSSKVTAERKDGVKGFHEMPGPRGLPVIGTLFQYIKKDGYGFNKLFKVFTKRRDEFGPVYRETLANMTSVIVSDPEEYAKVIRADGQMPIRMELGPFAHYRRTRGVKLGTVNAQGPEWLRMRNVVSKKALQVKGVLEFSVPMSRVADDLVHQIHTMRRADNTVHNLEFEVFKWAFESLGIFLFDMRLGCFEDPPLKDAQKYLTHLVGFFKEMQQLLFDIPLYKLYPTATWRRFEEHADVVHQLAQEIVEKRMESLCRDAGEDADDAGDGGCSFLNYLLQQKELPPDEASLHTVDFMIGGVETTASAVVWTLYMLSRAPEVQETLHREILSVLSDGEDINPQKLAKAPYVKACLKETFRLYPITFSTSRILQEPLEVGGYLVPPGVHLQANLWGMGRDPNLFPDPERYFPERWLRSNEEVLVGQRLAAKSYGTLPWGHGPRMCLGRRIAEQEIYIALIKIIQKFEVRIEGKLEPVLNTVMTPDRPAVFQFVPRKSLSSSIICTGSTFAPVSAELA